MIDSILLKMLKRSPISKVFGFDRGYPIDRYYIEKFICKNKKYISGDVLEIAGNTYTKKYGEHDCKSYIFNIDKSDKNADIIGNLEIEVGIELNKYDCFIMTQTLPFIFNIRMVAKNSIKLLKPGGTLLMTVPGITQISRYDMERWGHYWSFTDLSIKKLFEEFLPSKNIEIETFGNVKAATAFLYGLAQHEIKKKELDYTDRDYQVIIGAKITK